MEDGRKSPNDVRSGTNDEKSFPPGAGPMDACGAALYILRESELNAVLLFVERLGPLAY